MYLQQVYLCYCFLIEFLPPVGGLVGSSSFRSVVLKYSLLRVSYSFSRYNDANNRFMVWDLGPSLRCRLLLWI